MNKKVYQEQKEQLGNYDSNIYIIYMIYNRITQDKTVFLQNNLEYAKRQFIKSINHLAIEKPEEFELVEIGEWNKYTGDLKERTHFTVMVGYFEKLPDNQLKQVISGYVQEVMRPMVEQILEIKEIKKKELKIGDN